MFFGVTAVLAGVALIAAFARERAMGLMQSRGQQMTLIVRSVDLLFGALLLSVSLWEVLW